jgi:hypothetical protein
LQQWVASLTGQQWQTLNDEARQELDRYLAVDVVVRILKAKAIAATRKP